jgi:predicted regulator of Ras-like GTPase activity (Roadblock/LC7/MglB family)
VSADGIDVESELPSSVEERRVSAVSEKNLILAEQTPNESGHGGLNRVLGEADNRPVRS